jgi:hypothetical protein
MRLRELAEFDESALKLLYELGKTYAEHAIDGDDFPGTFDPQLDLDDESETVGVIEDEAKKKKGVFGLGRGA